MPRRVTNSSSASPPKTRPHGCRSAFPAPRRFCRRAASRKERARLSAPKSFRAPIVIFAKWWPHQFLGSWRAFTMSKRLCAEFLGTFWLVFGGCGSAVLAAAFPDVGIGLLGVSLAFGLTVLTMVYAVGGISGGHFNPAVSVGLLVAGRFPAKDLIPYVAAQIVGAVVGAVVLYLIASGKADFSLAGGFASNGYGEHSPGGYSMGAALLAEIVLTFMFLIIILRVTSGDVPAGFAPIAIGLTLTLIHLISIPVTNTSVNPARSTGPALLVGGWAIQQLWLFWVAPLLGAALAGFANNALFEKRPGVVVGTPA
ncbi:aquaporin Z [Allomesorhizobium alhagi]|nr:aquaporin Z [Mesorhizobium alhagi]